MSLTKERLVEQYLDEIDEAIKEYRFTISLIDNYHGTLSRDNLTTIRDSLVDMINSEESVRRSVKDSLNIDKVDAETLKHVYEGFADTRKFILDQTRKVYAYMQVGTIKN